MEFIILLGTLIFSSVVGGWGTSVLWNWFVATSFNISPISITQAIGLTLVFRLLKGFSLENEKSPSIGEIVYYAFKEGFMVLFFVAMGFIVKLFM